MKRLIMLLIIFTTSIRFSAGGASGTEIKPIYLSPRHEAQLVEAESTIALRFAETINARTVTNSALLVNGNISGRHKGDFFLARDGRTLIFEPKVPFAPGETVDVRLNAGLWSLAGNTLSIDNYSFTVTSSSEEVAHLEHAMLAPAMRYSPQPFVDLFAKSRSKNKYMTLPANFPEIIVSSPADETGEGYIFLSNFVVDWSSRGSIRKSRPFLLILDDMGEPVFYREMTPEIPTLDFKKQPNGLLTYVEWNGIHYALDRSYNIVQTYQAQNGYRTDIHDFQILPNEHVLIMIYNQKRLDMTEYGGEPDAVVTGLVIQEQDPDGNVVFQWRSWDHFKFEESAANLTGQFVDPVHGNSFELDYDGNLIISSRMMNEVTKIDWQTGDIIWRLGGKANEFTFINDPEPFFGQHDARRLANGNLTIFDNREGPGSTYSRAVEYKLVETGPDKTATLVWGFRSSPMSPALGNAQRLPNGNTMIGWGTHYPTLSEVKSNGEVALEISFADPDDPNLTRNSYRAFRFEWEGEPATNPMLVATDEIPGMTSLYTSWNGATNIGSYQIYAGKTLDKMSLITSAEKDGFETEIMIADVDQEYCLFKAMPLDKAGRETRFSNIASVRDCSPEPTSTATATPSATPTATGTVLPPSSTPTATPIGGKEDSISYLPIVFDQ